METRIITKNEEKEQTELLRKEVFDLKQTSNYYLDKILNNDLYVLATLDQKNIVAGCYFHRFDTFLVIDQVFVKKEYQNTGLKLGRELIKKLILSKEELEKLLGGNLTVCKIESQNKKAHDLYIKIGFNVSKLDDDYMYKSI